MCYYECSDSMLSSSCDLILHSVHTGISVEPALQHKKRVDGPPASLSMNFDEGKHQACDDFALLGQQQKFAPNVRYGLRPAKVSKPVEDKQSDLNNNNNANRDLPPPRKQMKLEETQVCCQHTCRVVETYITQEKGEKTTHEHIDIGHHGGRYR